MATDLTLYESVGNLTYKPIWSHPIAAPFEEFDHTADIAFTVRGETMAQLLLHAATALAFRVPALLPLLPTLPPAVTLEDSVAALNTIIATVDAASGCPLKAVSYHGDITTDADGVLSWEMIVDV